SARVEAVPRQPRRVVFDSEARLPLDGSLARSVGESPVIVVCSRAAPRRHVQALEAAGIEAITVTGENEAARVRAALDELGHREIQSLLLEGGPHLAGAFLDAGEVDEMRVFIAPPLAAELREGDSIAVNGVCLTAVAAADGSFRADVMAETLRRSSLGPLGEGDAVNLELPLRADARLGGHFVQGHVDGVGTVADVR